MTEVHDRLREDEHLRPLVEEHGELTLEPADDFYQRFVTSILRQQVSMASAAATRERLFDAVEVTPEGVLDADVDVLRDAGLSQAKARYVRNVAEAFLERGYSREHFEGMSHDEVVDELTTITGVGEWTAHMQLMFALGREDVFPVGDLGIRKGMRNVVDPDLTRAEMVDYSERWSPYRTYASLYLWRAQDDVSEDVPGAVQD
ncbi:DNA-3-methyladenine glycosylase family protein [Halomicrobium salinisoli]|uniref:DNA-3-methyladenine glycosylase family protein n=1 Tax=Halomicrobium salinisoli TaxID=2878391 RepID=UPI001CF041FD|nr:DNA-3-methyladenine glycosylase 2 family protein [Halomicrobium salinisoli]